MSDPLSDRCLYCGSPAVLDDAWFCSRPKCYAAYEAETTQQGFNDKLRACGLIELLPRGTDASAAAGGFPPPSAPRSPGRASRDAQERRS